VLGLRVKFKLAFAILQLVRRKGLLCRLKVTVATSQRVTIAKLVGQLFLVVFAA